MSAALRTRLIHGHPHFWIAGRWRPAISGGTGYEIAALAIAAVGAATTAVGTIATGQAQAASARYQEKVAGQQAEVAAQAGAAAEQQQRDRTRRLMALQRADIGGSGVTTEGTPLMTLLDTARQAELDALRARYSGQIQEHAYTAQRGLYSQAASNAEVGGAFGAGTTLLTGASNIAQRLYLRPGATAGGTV